MHVRERTSDILNIHIICIVNMHFIGYIFTLLKIHIFSFLITGW